MFQMNNLYILLIVLVLMTNKWTKASVVSKSQKESTVQTSQSSDTNSISNGQQTMTSKSIYDTLESIDQRLQQLQTNDNTYKLTRIDYTLDQLTQRIVSIENKFLRLENSLDSKFAKIEEILNLNDRKTEFKTETITRKINDLNDNFNNFKYKFELKLEPKINQIIEKLDSEEKLMQTNSNQVLEKVVKYEERHTVFESHVKSHIMNIENLVKHSLDANTNIKEMVTYGFESVNKLVDTVKDQRQHQNNVIARLTTITNQIQNSSQSNQRYGNQINEELFTKCNNKCDVNETNERDNYVNILSTLQQLKELGVDQKLTQLDVNVDYFSRKIINIIQEMWRSSQSSENYLREAIDTANKTHSLMHQEFNRLQELIGPQIKIPDFSDIREPLEQKLYHLSTTIDDSFNALMISQNSFISSCSRIQEEEEQLYDILDDMLLEIRNKSSLDVSSVKESLNGVTLEINQSLNQLKTKMTALSDKLIKELREGIQLNNSKTSIRDSSDEECFLNKSQLIGICQRYESIINSNESETLVTNDEDLPSTH